MTWTNITSHPQERTYTVTQGPQYNGIIHDHPRISMQVQQTNADQAGSIGPVLIRNYRLRREIIAYGVNHWAWDGNGLVLWPVEHAQNWNDSMLQDYHQICAPGETIQVVYYGKPGERHFARTF